MMAQPVPHQQSEKKRAKVYELRNDDWFDRGTGFCSFSLERVCIHLFPSYTLYPACLDLKSRD